MEADQGVRDLGAHSCDAVARGDVDAWTACWRDDGDWVIPGREPVVGVVQLRDVFARLRAGRDLCVQEVLAG